MEILNKMNLRDGDIITEDKLAIIDSNVDKYNANTNEILNTLGSADLATIDKTVKGGLNELGSQLNDIVIKNDRDIAEQSARIDNISKLGEGSTSGDAELIDIRVGIDGKTYENAGNAVREQIKDCKNRISSVSLLETATVSNSYIANTSYADMVISNLKNTNIFDYDNNPLDGYTNIDITTGNYQEFEDYMGTRNFIPIDKNIDFTINTSDTKKAKCSIAYYNNEKQFISGETTETPHSPDNAEFIRFSVWIGVGGKAPEKIWINKGNDPYDYVPYTYEINIFGKNIYDFDSYPFSDSTNINSDGSITTWDDYKGTKEFIPFYPNINFSVYISTYKSLCQIAFFDKNKQFISYKNGTEFNSPENTKFIKLSTFFGTAGKPSNVMIALSSNETENMEKYYKNTVIVTKDSTLLTSTSINGGTTIISPIEINIQYCMQPSTLKDDIKNISDKLAAVTNITTEIENINTLNSIIRLEINGDLDGQGISKDNKVKANLTFNINGNLKTYPIKIAWQGNGSLQYPKKNYAITFYKDDMYSNKKKIKINDWYPSDSYHLKSNFYDFTMLRNSVGTKLANEFIGKSLPANAMAFVDSFPVVIYLNGDWYGCYTLNLKQDNLLFNMDINNGNHLAYRANSAIDFTDTSYWEFRGDAKETEIMKSKLQRILTWAKSASDSEFKNNISQYFDIDSALGYLLFAQLGYCQDSLNNNLTLATWNGSIWYHIYYDLDICFNAAQIPFDDNIEYNINFSSNVFLDKLNRNFQDELKDMYKTWRDNLFIDTDYINNTFMEFYNDWGAENLKKEKDRWFPQRRGYSELINTRPSILKDWLSKRIEYLDGKYSYDNNLKYF